MPLDADAAQELAALIQTALVRMGPDGSFRLRTLLEMAILELTRTPTSNASSTKNPPDRPSER